MWLLPVYYWALISLHVLGGALLFRRVFPRESPWFGLVVPPLALILLLNCIEHIVALPMLVWLLPVTIMGCIYLLLDPATTWRGLRLPSGIFLAAFALTLCLRLLKPNILDVNSGTYDLPLVSTFCMGQKLPPAFCWFPPYPMGQYYALVHYSASVLTRLLHVDVGTGFNLSSALMSAWIVYASAAIAWRVSRQRVWITIVSAIVVQCASNGPSPLLWLERWPVDPCDAGSLFNAMDYPTIHPLMLKVLNPVADPYARRELEVPGLWSWLGTFHATNGGQLLTLFSVWSLVELLRRRKANWPWIGLIVSPPLMLVTSTWGLPFVGIIMVAGLAVAFAYRLRPENYRFVFGTLATTALLLFPMLNNYLPTEIALWFHPTHPEGHTQFLEFFIYWWPVFVPWVTVLFIWRRLGPAVWLLWALTPLFFWAVESYTIAARFDMTGKTWGYLWSLSWSVLFPIVAMRRTIGFRILLGVLLLANAISLAGWVNWTWRTMAGPQERWTLTGTATYEVDPEKKKIFQFLEQKQGQVFLTGLTSPNSTQGALLASFTRNYSLVCATFYVQGFFCPDAPWVPGFLAQEVDDFYNGKCDQPLLFVRQMNITGVIVWPEDNMSDARVARLKEQLAPLYEYQDFRTSGGPNAGIFVYRPRTNLTPPRT